MEQQEQHEERKWFDPKCSQVVKNLYYGITPTLADGIV